MLEDLSQIDPSQEILHSNNALGHGIINDVHDIIYVKSKGFNPANNLKIAAEIDSINMNFLNKEKNYILVGPGRWGSSDSWLGIPVKWSQISNARVLVELALDNYKIEPSQGTHFFQNLTSFGVGYFSINSFLKGDGIFDEVYLNSQPAIYESEYVRHIRFADPMIIKINGKKNIGIVLKP